MAPNLTNKFLSILLLLISVTNTAVVTAVPENELTTMLTVLRARGYHLFANAITTSDIHYEIISGSNFTFFAPIDSALFALDMTMAASDYVTTLRFHVVPRRLSIADIRRLPSGSSAVPTLMPGHDIFIEQRRSPLSPLAVDGVDITIPGLFYGRNLAVHGLEGILSFRSQSRNVHWNHTNNSPSNFTGNHTSPSPITNFTNHHSSRSPIRVRRHRFSFHTPPHPPTILTENHTVAFPVGAPPPRSSNLTENHTIASPVAAPSPQPSNLTRNHSVAFPVASPSPQTSNSTGNLSFAGPVAAPPPGPSNLTGNHMFAVPAAAPHHRTSNLTGNHTVEIPKAAPHPQAPNLTGNHTVAVPMAAPPLQTSNLTGNHTVPVTVAVPTISAPPAISPASGNSLHLATRHNHQHSSSASTEHHRFEDHHSLRAKLLELSSEGDYELTPATPPTHNVLQEFSTVGEQIVDCPLADDEEDRLHVANIRHGYLYRRELYTTSAMTCAQR